MPKWNCPRVGDKYRINVRDLYQWTITISVRKNDGHIRYCYECDSLIGPGEIQGRVSGAHFCMDCVGKNIIE
jgi:hypothetical protein